MIQEKTYVLQVPNACHKHKNLGVLRFVFVIFFDISQIHKNDQRVLSTLLACSD